MKPSFVVIIQTMETKHGRLSLAARSAAIIIMATMTFGCCNQKQARIKVPELPPPVSKQIKDVKVALVLGSGGFKCAAHIGVLEVLEENNIPIDLIVGSSSGSFVGAFYADDPNVQAIKKKLMSADFAKMIDPSWISIIRSAFYPTGPIRGYALQKFMLTNLRSRNFDELKIPLLVTTTSLMNNKTEIIQTGPIIPAVHASMALPPYFAPVNVYEDTFVDGGVLAPVPVFIAKAYGPKYVIAVDICKRPSRVEPENAFQITTKAIDLSYYAMAESQAKAADVVIRPDIRGYGPFDYEDVEEYYKAGRRAALLQIDQIKAAVLQFQTQAP